MVTVIIHYDDLINPDIYFSISEKTEQRVINHLRKKYYVERSSPEVWYGQDNPAYAIHHWDAKERRKQK